MKQFIFRNSTVENLFGTTEVMYSGYNDIHTIDFDADLYIWFYMLPVKVNRQLLCEEIHSYYQDILYIREQIPSNKNLLVFTLQNFLDFKYLSGDFSVEEAVSSFNSQIAELAAKQANVKLIDFSRFTKKYASEQLIDWKYFFISKIQLNPKISKTFHEWFNKELDAIQLKRKKCIVLDLDNTLWGGILGEDGITGIKIGGDYPGNAFLMFQQFLIELEKNGVILTICSKNNEQDVLDLWEQNPYIMLKKEHIAAYRINWNNKAQNIRELADELNIGLDSMVMVDDNPSERELIRQLLPMVETPDFPEHPYLLPQFMNSLTSCFYIYSVTKEDLLKTEQYKANSERIRESKKYDDFNEYLKSLQIELKIDTANPFNISRIAQMTQKTNQFNLTTQRYTDTDILNFVEKGDFVYCLNVKDKFGDNGNTGCLILKKSEDEREVIIDTFLLSCRILGKGIEMAFLNTVLNIMKEKGYKNIQATYIPTLKNIQVKDFYEKAGFELVDSGSGNKIYRIDLEIRTFQTDPIYEIKL